MEDINMQTLASLTVLTELLKRKDAQEIISKIPKMYEFLKRVANETKSAMEDYPVACAVMLYFYAHVTFAFDHAVEAQKLMLTTDSTMDELVKDIDCGFFDIFHTLDNMIQPSGDVDNDKEQQFKTLLNKVVDSLKKYCQDIRQKMTDSTVEREKITTLMWLSHCCFSGSATTASLALVPAIPFTLTTLPLCAVAFSAVGSLLFLARFSDIKNSQNKALASLPKAIEKASRAEKALRMVLIEISHHEQRPYEYSDICRMIRNLYPLVSQDSRDGFQKFDKYL